MSDAAPKKRVTLTWDPDRTGTVVAEGPEQTEVHWDDLPRGHTRIQTNKELVPLDEGAPKKRRRRSNLPEAT